MIGSQTIAYLPKTLYPLQVAYLINVDLFQRSVLAYLPFNFSTYVNPVFIYGRVLSCIKSYDHRLNISIHIVHACVVP